VTALNSLTEGAQAEERALADARTALEAASQAGGARVGLLTARESTTGDVDAETAADIEPEATPPMRIRLARPDRFVATTDRARGAGVEFIRGESGAVEWMRLGGRIGRRPGTGA